MSKNNFTYYTYNERQELNELSTRIFGRSSRWQKMVKAGKPRHFASAEEIKTKLLEIETNTKKLVAEMIAPQTKPEAFTLVDNVNNK
jgi:hypothetical protein